MAIKNKGAQPKGGAKTAKTEETKTAPTPVADPTPSAEETAEALGEMLDEATGGDTEDTDDVADDAEDAGEDTGADADTDNDADSGDTDADATPESKLHDFAAAQSKREKEKKAPKLRKDGLAALPSLPRASKARPPKPCACGCVNPTTKKPNMTRGGSYLPGHDGRPKGWALRVERGVCELKDVPDGEREVVAKLLKARKAAVSPDAATGAKSATPKA